MWDFYERDAAPGGLGLEAHWHNLLTGEEHLLGAGRADTFGLAGEEAAVEREVPMVSPSPDAVCKGFLTVQIRLLAADAMPGGDAFRPRAATPPWWNAPGATTGLVRTPLHRRGVGTRNPPNTPLLPSPQKVERLQGDSGAGPSSQAPGLVVRVRGWDKTRTRMIVKSDDTGVRGGGRVGLVPERQRCEQRENVLAQFHVKSSQVRLLWNALSLSSAQSQTWRGMLFARVGAASRRRSISRATLILRRRLQRFSNGRIDGPVLLIGLLSYWSVDRLID